MEYSYESEMRGRHVMKKTSMTSSITRKSFQSESEGQRRLVEMEAKGQPFGRHDMKKFSKEEYSTMSSESFSYKGTNNSFSSVYERSDTTKFIGGGDNRRFLEPFTKSSDRSDEQSVVPVMKNKSQIDVPEWMEEQKSPGTERRDVDISDINAFLEYPSNYSPRKKELEDKVKESKIHPEVAKRDKKDIPMLPAEEDDEDKEWSVTTKTIGGGENRFVEYFTKSSDHGNEQPFVVVMKNRSQINVPEWMVEQKSHGTEYRDVDISNINVFLKYPNDCSTKKEELEDKVSEGNILPEVAKRNKQDIPMLPAEEDDEEESDEESDEFEEEIVVMNVRRNPLWRKGLQIPKPEPEKVGIPIEDLLEIPTLEAKQESAPNELLIDEKIESVERPPVVHAEVPDFGILEKL